MNLQMREEKVQLTRKQQMVPGVIYGRTIKPVSVKVDAKELKKAYRKFGESMTFKANLEGKVHQVYIKDIQCDPIDRSNILHFDMIKVSATDKMTANIPVQTIGEADVEKKGLFVQVVATTLEAEYQVGKGVASIELDVTGFDLGDTVCVKDIRLPKGINILDDPEKMVIKVTEPSYKPLEEEKETMADKEEGGAGEAEEQKSD